MSTRTSVVTPVVTTPVLWPRLARTRLEVLSSTDQRPRRALVVGPAGSGKSTMLRALRRALTGGDTNVVLAHRGLDISAVPPTDLLLVDDAHLLDESQLHELEMRLDHVEAEVIVATRPHPQIETLQEIGRSLERSGPAVVLGQITLADARANADAGDSALTDSCLQSILDLTGGIAWLTA